MKSQPFIVIRENAEEMAIFLLGLFKEELEQKKKGEFLSIALSGGSTPGKIFDWITFMGKETVNWHNILFFWVDERCVPPHDDESNYKMTRLHLLDPLGIGDDQVFRMKGEAAPEAEAARYTGILAENLPQKCGLPCFDLVLLGLGDDGHTASIFPGNEDLFHTTRTCTVAVNPNSGQKRITLTGPAINNGKKVVFIVTGHEKAKIVAEIVSNRGTDKYPATLVSPANGSLLWLLDGEAASLLDLAG